MCSITAPKFRGLRRFCRPPCRWVNPGSITAPKFRGLRRAGQRQWLWCRAFNYGPEVQGIETSPRQIVLSVTTTFNYGPEVQGIETWRQPRGWIGRFRSITAPKFRGLRLRAFKAVNAWGRFNYGPEVQGIETQQPCANCRVIVAFNYGPEVQGIETRWLGYHVPLF